MVFIFVENLKLFAQTSHLTDKETKEIKWFAHIHTTPCSAVRGTWPRISSLVQVIALSSSTLLTYISWTMGSRGVFDEKPSSAVSRDSHWTIPWAISHSLPLTRSQPRKSHHCPIYKKVFTFIISSELQVTLWDRLRRYWSPCRWGNGALEFLWHEHCDKEPEGHGQLPQATIHWGTESTWESIN